MEHEILRTALGPGRRVPVDGTSSAATRTARSGPPSARPPTRHVRGCLNCQAELALLQAVTSGDVRPGEADVVRDGVARLERRAAEIFGAASVAASPAASLALAWHGSPPLRRWWRWSSRAVSTCASASRRSFPAG